MIIAPNSEGVWRDESQRNGPDSHLLPSPYNPNNRYGNIVGITIGTVRATEPEPVFREHSVEVELVRGGVIGGVGWPGPNVVVDSNGDPTGSNVGIHGLFEAPLPGQQVLIGWVDGESHSPIVLQRYPYNSSQNPSLIGAHLLPMTNKLHGPNDVILGSYIGSYVALRGTLPVPGSVEISAEGLIKIDAAVTIDIQAVGDLTMGGAVVTIEAQGAMNLNASPSVVVNTGTRAVAAMGDLTVTMLGPMPIQATGIDVLVP